MTREMKDSGVEWIGQIPKEWNLQRIKFTLKQRIENNSPIKSKNILSLTAKQGVIPISEKEGGGNKPKEDLSSYRLAYPNDIVMNSMNILSGSVGLSKYFGCVSPVYYMFNIKEQYGDIRYYNYIFQTKVFQKSLFGLGNGILIKESENGNLNTIRMRIPAEKFGNLLIPVPSVSTQRLISNFLDSKCSQIDSILTSLQNQIDTLEQYKKSVITEAVTKGLNPNVEMKDSGIEWIGEIPKHWKIDKGKYIFKYQLKPVKEDDGVITCFRDGEVTLRTNRRTEGFTESFKEFGYQGIDVGDLIVHGMDGFAGAIGISDSRGKASPVLNNLDTDYIKRYYMYLLRMYAWKGVFVSLATGIRVRTCDTNWGKLKELPYVVFDKNEQQQIVDYLDTKCSQIDSIISQKKELIEILKEYKKSLIYEYVTGKKEVPNA